MARLWSRGITFNGIFNQCNILRENVRIEAKQLNDYWCDVDPLFSLMSGVTGHMFLFLDAPLPQQKMLRNAKANPPTGVVVPTSSLRSIFLDAEIQHTHNNQQPTTNNQQLTTTLVFKSHRLPNHPCSMVLQSPILPLSYHSLALFLF